MGEDFTFTFAQYEDMTTMLVPFNAFIYSRYMLFKGPVYIAINLLSSLAPRRLNLQRLGDLGGRLSSSSATGYFKSWVAYT
jgi:hypothetical protein